MSDFSSSDVEIIKEIKRKPSSNSSIPEPENSSPDDVDSPDDFDLDPPSVNVSEKENEEEEKKETKTIKSITNHRVKQGKVQYKVKYKGKFPSEWVDEDDLIDQADLIAKYIESETSKPPKEEKVDLTNMNFEIISAIKKNDKIYYQLRYENNETTLISAKKMHALDSAKLIKFLEKYCIKENKVEQS